MTSSSRLFSRTLGGFESVRMHSKLGKIETKKLWWFLKQKKGFEGFGKGQQPQNNH
jgi:hypothetical protein